MTIEANPDHGVVHGRNAAATDEVKGIASDAEKLLKDAAKAAVGELAAARAKLGERLGEARHRIVDVGGAVAGKARGAVGATDDYVRHNPWKTVGIAAAVGLVGGLVLGRREACVADDATKEEP